MWVLWAMFTVRMCMRRDVGDRLTAKEGEVLVNLCERILDDAGVLKSE